MPSRAQWGRPLLPKTFPTPPGLFFVTPRKRGGLGSNALQPPWIPTFVTLSWSGSRLPESPILKLPDPLPCHLEPDEMLALNQYCARGVNGFHPLVLFQFHVANPSATLNLDAALLYVSSTGKQVEPRPPI